MFRYEIQMSHLLVLILAVAGAFIPPNKDSFLVTQDRMDPLLFLRQDAGLWEAYFLKESTGEKKFYSVFHLNGLAIGRQTSNDFKYSDVTEIIAINSLHDLKGFEPLLTKGGGNIYIHSNKEDELVIVNYSPNNSKKQDVEVHISWADKRLE